MDHKNVIVRKLPPILIRRVLNEWIVIDKEDNINDKAKDFSAAEHNNMEDGNTESVLVSRSIGGITNINEDEAPKVSKVPQNMEGETSEEVTINNSRGEKRKCQSLSQGVGDMTEENALNPETLICYLLPNEQFLSDEDENQVIQRWLKEEHIYSYMKKAKLNFEGASPLHKNK